MYATTVFNRLMDDLAASWTDSALEMLKEAGVRPISVDMELDAWRTLKGVLQWELHWQRSFRVSTLVSLSTLMEQVLRKAMLVIAAKFDPRSVSFEFESRIRGFIRDRRASAAEREIYTALVRQPAMRAAFKPPTRTDYVPRLRVSGVGSSPAASSAL